MSETLIRMPKLADTLVEGTVGQWLKRVGDDVTQGEALATIETDKVTTELTSPAAGTLLELLVADGQTVPIETPIARIGAAAPTNARAPKPTPVAARLLEEHGLGAAQIATRTGRLTRADVLAHLAASTPTQTEKTDRPSTQRPSEIRPGDLVPLTSMRRAIADHMVEASQSIPHGQTVMAADLTGLFNWREAHKASFQQEEQANLTFTVFFVRTLAHQLASHQNASVDVGVAVALDAGLIVPVLRSADSLNLGATARAIADLAARARANKLAPDETQGALMTVTNVGSFGSLTASPIIPLGQLGILGPGLVESRPLPSRDGGIRPGYRCLISFMFDRRAFDDLAADRFLRAIIDELSAAPQP